MTTKIESDIVSTTESVKLAAAGQCFGIVQDLEDKLPERWWETLFDEMYLKTDGDVVEDDSITLEEVETILNCLNLAQGATLLDMCCGQGRHLLCLAKLRPDLKLWGIDQSDFLINTAKHRAEEQKVPNANFKVGDCSALPYEDKQFSAVIVMGNSFGYFERESVDSQVLGEIFRVLKPEGQCLLDLTDGGFMKANFSPRSWEWIDSATFVCRERQLARDGRRLISREVITSTTDGVIRDQFYAERLYTFPELNALLGGQGFESSEQVDVLTGEKSERNQDLGMMAHRMLIKSLKPPSSDLVETSELELETSILLPENITAPPLLVVMGDPSLPSSEKLNQTWNPEDIETIEILRQAVVSSFGADREVRFLDSHQRLYFDLVSASMMDVKPLIFNLCDEGYLNHARLEMHVPALLDLLQLPYTGAAPACLAICYDKGLVNALAGQLGVPVPAELYIPAYLDVDALSQAELESLFAKMVFPAFVKPVRGDGSVGITAASVVKSIAAAVAYIKVVRQDINVLTKDVIVQEYLCGDEVSVGIIGNPRLGAHGKVDLTSACFMPVLKADFSALPKDLPPILAYDSKWNPESPYWTDVCYKPATITEEQQNALYQHCAVLCERFELRDFGRFDWRWSNASGCFKLLEVNPNPGWCHDGKAAIMAKMMGLSYPEMIAKIVTSAEERMMRSASK